VCIIVAKNKGIQIPSKKILENCFNYNNDGAGFMFNYNNQVYMYKGYMQFDAFYKAILKVEKQIDIKKTSMVFHFRIGTHGKTKNSAYCHPFPITDDENALKKLSIKGIQGIAHNGILYNYTYDKSLSDTMVFIRDFITPLYNAKIDMNNIHIKKLISNQLGSGNKLAILDDKGIITLYGEYIEDEKIMYSNSSYKTYQTKFDCVYDDDFPLWYNKKIGLKNSDLYPINNEIKHIITDDNSLITNDGTYSTDDDFNLYRNGHKVGVIEDLF